MSRRGRPKTIYSDNATNFRRTGEDLSKTEWKKIIEQSAERRIDWKFIPPAAPWWGGWWERIIRLIKDVLKRTLGRAALTIDELQTVLCEIEAVVNSRPLVYLSEEDQVIPLTPALFLQDLQDVYLPDVSCDDNAKLRNRIRYRREVAANLRLRFRDEYLSQLKMMKSKSQASARLRKGDVILVSDDSKKRVMWPLARVVEVYPGKDGVVRYAKVKTAKGFLVRPIQRLIPLEASSTTEDAPEERRVGEGALVNKEEPEQRRVNGHP